LKIKFFKKREYLRKKSGGRVLVTINEKKVECIFSSELLQWEEDDLKRIREGKEFIKLKKKMKVGKNLEKSVW